MEYFISVNIFKTKTKNVMAPVCEKFHRVTLFNDDADKVWNIEEITHTLIHTRTQSNKKKTARLISYLFSFVKCRF